MAKKKPTLVARTESLLLEGMEWPIVQLDYREKKRTWRQRYDGSLSLRVSHAYRGNQYDNTFVWAEEITFAKLHGDFSKDRELVDAQIVEYVLNVTEELRLVTDSHLTAEQFDEFERQFFNRIAVVTERPRIAKAYGDVKEKRLNRENAQEQGRLKELQEKEDERLRLEESDRQRQIDRRRDRLSHTIKDSLKSFELDAMYSISREVSKKLDYNLPKSRIEERVRQLFDPDDNMAHRPLFKSTNRGEWAVFMQKTLGEGFYHKLSNLEQDLDDFYLSVFEAVQDKVGEDGKVTEEMYNSAMCENASLDEVLDLIERERDINVDLLTRLGKIVDQRPVNYRKVVEHLSTLMSFKGCLFTAVKPAVPGFDFNYSIGNDPEEFREVCAQIEDDLQEYFKDNDKKLRVPTEGRIDTKDGVIIVSPDNPNEHLSQGSYGKVMNYQNRNHDPYVKFTFLTGKSVKLPYGTNPYGNSLKKAEPIDKAYSSMKDAASAVLETAISLSIKATTDTTLTETQQKITEYHPYRDEQVRFTEGFYQGMKERFEQMFERHKAHNSK